MYLLLEKLFRITPLPPPSTCSAAEPTHPTAAQGHNELAYKCWYAQLDAYSNAATVILAGERRRHSVDSRIAMRRTACPDARLGALLWCRRKASGRAAQVRPSGRREQQLALNSSAVEQRSHTTLPPSHVSFPAKIWRQNGTLVST